MYQKCLGLSTKNCRNRDHFTKILLNKVFQPIIESFARFVLMYTTRTFCIRFEGVHSLQIRQYSLPTLQLWFTYIIPSWLIQVESITYLLFVALSKWLINRFKLVQQSRTQVLRAYYLILYIYMYCEGGSNLDNVS